MNYACPDCGVSIEELTPRMFSFNSPYGACPECSGLGVLMKISPDILFPDKNLTLRQGALNAMGFNTGDENGIAAQYLAAMGPGQEQGQGGFSASGRAEKQKTG